MLVINFHTTDRVIGIAQVASRICQLAFERFNPPLKLVHLRLCTLHEPKLLIYIIICHLSAFVGFLVVQGGLLQLQLGVASSFGFGS
jgi:hypothetical protein